MHNDIGGRGSGWGGLWRNRGGGGWYRYMMGTDNNAMKNLMAGLWKPSMKMYVKELGTNLYLFQFAHEIDIARVIDGSPWSFNKWQFIFKRLKDGDQA